MWSNFQLNPSQSDGFVVKTLVYSTFSHHLIFRENKQIWLTQTKKKKKNFFFFTKIFNKIFQPNFLPKFLNKIFQQNFSIKFFNKIFQPNFSTKFFNNIFQQNFSTKFINKIFQSTKFFNKNLGMLMQILSKFFFINKS